MMSIFPAVYLFFEIVKSLGVIDPKEAAVRWQDSAA